MRSGRGRRGGPPNPSPAGLCIFPVSSSRGAPLTLASGTDGLRGRAALGRPELATSRADVLALRPADGRGQARAEECLLERPDALHRRPAELRPVPRVEGDQVDLAPQSPQAAG